jgi:subtilisin family serine protease
MRTLLTILALVIASNVWATPLVFKDEYVLYKVSPDLTTASSDDKVLLVKTKGGHLRTARHEESRMLKPYDTRGDKCPIVSQGYVCSPNFLIRPAFQSNDPYYKSQMLYGINGTFGVGADKVWDSTNGSGALVAVLDTGIDLNHPDLKQNIWINPGEALDGSDTDGNGYTDDVWGFNFANAGLPFDYNGHGTHVAGTVAAVSNHIGVVGVAYSSKLIAVKIIGDSGGGSIFSAIKGINYVTSLAKSGHNIVAINASWGSPGFSEPLRQAIQEAAEQGILFIAAAGNQGVNNDKHPYYPATFGLPNILSVGAIDSGGNVATFSNYGVQTVHLFAPGVGIWSTIPDRRYDLLSGTSMSAPHVTGVAALLQGGLADRRHKILTGVTKRENLAKRCTTAGTANALGSVSGAPPVCKKKKCIKCCKACKEKYKKKKKRRKCRTKCRYTYNCDKGVCKK